MDIKTIQIKRMEHSLTCLRGQIGLMDHVVTPIVLETISVLERELKELKQCL